MRELKDLIKFGNSKLPKTTMIMDMGSSKDCPSRKLGLCMVIHNYGDNGCYARQPELFRKACLPRRNACAEYWLNHTAQEIYDDIDAILKRKRIKPSLFRFNEVGDFYSQACVDKLSIISYLLKTHHNITTYGYSARKDLSFYQAHFKVKSSGHYNGNNGRTVVVKKSDEDLIKHYVSLGYKICPGDCHKCNTCVGPDDILFIKR